MEERVRKQVVKRLSYIGGHVAGIRRMAEADRYCVDILKQSYAARKALEKMESMVLEAHLKACVAEGISSQSGAQIIDELIDLYKQSNR